MEPTEETPMMSGGKGAWMAHVKKTMRANKGKKLGVVLKMASKTFKKSKRGGGGLSPQPLNGGAAPLTPASVGGRRRRRGSRKSRGTRKH